jgi:hypothetical protein
MNEHTPGTWVVTGPHHTERARGYHVHARESLEHVAFNIPKIEDARLITKAPRLLAFVKHVLAMDDDAYLSGHPEWAAIVDEAKSLEGSS